ncbi:MAG: hypothetical protein LBQ15_11140 [Clostridium sp.]|jgi:hypothetical protein|nr:hypothetical protein [Clostridium sp.]
MTIQKVKTSGYDSVKPGAIAYDIQVIAATVNELVNLYGTPQQKDAQKEVLAACNKTQLKAIAAELATVEKRLRYILLGQY